MFCFSMIFCNKIFLYKKKKIFLQFKFKICAYTQLKSKKYIKNDRIPQSGCTTPPSVPELGDSGVKDTSKTNKRLRYVMLHTGRI